MTRIPLIAANWKLHGRRSWADKPGEFARACEDRPDSLGIEVLICPPYPYLADLANPHGVMVGAQDCSQHVSGAHTGEVSAQMLNDVGCDYVIVGHSERRAAGDTDADVLAKAEAAQWAGLVPIVCVGESLDVREAGDAVETVLAQLERSRPPAQSDKLDDYVVAYEPVWAIGTGKVATPGDIAEMHGAIRGVVGEDVRVIYGGSVKPGNARDVFGAGDVDGALIGGAGLEMGSLAEIAGAMVETVSLRDA